MNKSWRTRGRTAAAGPWGVKLSAKTWELALVSWGTNESLEVYSRETKMASTSGQGSKRQHHRFAVASKVLGETKMLIGPPYLLVVAF